MAREWKRMDIKNFNVQLIIAGMAGLIDEGNTAHEVFEIVEDIKRQTFHGLAELRRENQEAEKNGKA